MPGEVTVPHGARGAGRKDPSSPNHVQKRQPLSRSSWHRVVGCRHRGAAGSGRRAGTGSGTQTLSPRTGDTPVHTRCSYPVPPQLTPRSQSPYSGPKATGSTPTPDLSNGTSLFPTPSPPIQPPTSWSDLPHQAPACRLPRGCCVRVPLPGTLFPDVRRLPASLAPGLS